MEKQNIVEDRKTSIVHAFTCIPEIKVVVYISILNILNSTVKSIIKSYRYYGNYMIGYNNKRPTGLNGHLSIRDFTLNSCQKSAYLHLDRSAPLLLI